MSTYIVVELLQPMARKVTYKNRIELLQGTLDMLILKTLQWGEQHGHGISQAHSGELGDVLQVETGSLYRRCIGWNGRAGSGLNGRRASDQHAEVTDHETGQGTAGFDYERWGKMVATIEGIMTAK